MISCINATLTSVEFVVLLSNSLVSVDHDIYLQQTISLVHAGDIIRDGERKSWDPPMIGTIFLLRHPDDIYPRGSTRMSWVLVRMSRCVIK